MSDFRRRIVEMNLDAEFLDFSASVHTVEDAAQAAGVSVSAMTKNLLLVDELNRPVIAVLSGTERLDVQKLATLLGRRLRMAKASEVQELIGFEAGAVPLVVVEGTLVLDVDVAEKPFIYSSGGTTRSLVKIPTRKLIEAMKPLVGDIAFR